MATQGWTSQMCARITTGKAPAQDHEVTSGSEQVKIDDLTLTLDADTGDVFGIPAGTKIKVFAYGPNYPQPHFSEIPEITIFGDTRLPRENGLFFRYNNVIVCIVRGDGK